MGPYLLSKNLKCAPLRGRLWTMFIGVPNSGRRRSRPSDQGVFKQGPWFQAFWTPRYKRGGWAPSKLPGQPLYGRSLNNYQANGPYLNTAIASYTSNIPQNDIHQDSVLCTSRSPALDEEWDDPSAAIQVHGGSNFQKL